MFEIAYSKAAIKTLRSIQPKQRDNIRAKIVEFAKDPAAPNNNVIALKGRPGVRMRVGDFRVIMVVNDRTVTIEVEAVAPRGKVYR
tara:strand:- start:510 stop:767 length:258 start_codon:yes stop_codon:yes gene_type:complete